ncbi:hypothetical protein [Yersinia enterocolitica]|uniref:hypothetical protein n=1 Tax=Yersinia enterocolitica TaxID=630 RepID=UPI000A83CF7F|nr:hypothetical protein [Yersinia enterocolitica]
MRNETIEETKEQMAGIETTAPKYTDLKFNDIAGKVDFAASQNWTTALIITPRMSMLGLHR